MKLSIIYCFKDRDLARVKRSIESLYPQLENTDEIVFVDYGSNANIKVEVEIYLKDFLQIKYIYVEAQGRLWNRSHALNIGVKHSFSDYVMMADIDLIFSQSFLTKLKSQLQTAGLVNYQCHYLPQKFNKYDKLLNQPSKYAKSYKKSTHEGLGLMAVKKNIFEEINGYDEYYLVWGMEDNDIIHRFQLMGKETTWLKADTYVFHQWHPTSGIRTRENIAKGWQNQMRTYFEEHKDIIKRQHNWGICFSRRDFIKQAENNDFFHDLSKHSPIYAALLIKTIIHKSKTGDILQFLFQDDELKELEKTKTFQLIKWFNKLANRLKFPFLLESELYFFGSKRTLYDFRDLYHYLVLEYEKELEDYHLYNDDMSLKITIKIN